MDTLNIGTSQNIEIEQSIASIGERIVATLLDTLFILVYFILIISIYSGSQSKALLTILTIPVSLYSLASELAMNGQSWGKKIMKIKVVKNDGTSTTFSSYFLRWILRLVEVVIFFGSLAMITIILNRKGQRLGDIAANTTVIRLRYKTLRETIYTKIPEDYTLVYPEISGFSITDIYTIKEVLELLNTPAQNSKRTLIAQKAHTAIERKLNIRANQDTEVFFRTILSDYNYINRK
jgi:uncharacterized RDD family membrane protein YckC